MTYISLIDELALDLDSISNLDTQSIIKLQKQLKAKAILDGDSNIGEISALIEDLKSDSTRAKYVFVEKNKWLKKLLMGRFQEMRTNETHTDLSEITDYNDIKQFLEPYLIHQIKRFLYETLTNRHYNLLLSVLLQNILFSEEINQIIINFFKSKLEYVQIYIREGKLKENVYPIYFINNPIFIKCLNQFPDSLLSEIRELNSEVTELFNNHINNVEDSQFLYAARTLVAFGNLNVSNEHLKEILNSNAQTAKTYNHTGRGSKPKSKTAFKLWPAIIVIILLFKLISFFQGINSRPKKTYNQQDIFNTHFFQPESEDNLKNLSLIYYWYPSFSTKYGNKNDLFFPIKKYQNPYEGHFYQFDQPASESDITYDMTYVKNKTDKDLILFLLFKDYDKSAFIPRNDSIAVQIERSDTLIFYSGTNFVKSDLIGRKYFKKNQYMSSLYIIDSINFDEPHAIDIFPEIIDSQKEDNSAKSDSVHLKNIFYSTKTFSSTVKDENLKKRKSN